MLPSLFQSNALPVLEQVVNFTQSRHGVLAGNIANIDTPGYKTRDLSPELFQEKLKEAIEVSRNPQNNPHVSRAGFNGYVPGGKTTQSVNAFQKVQESTHSILYHDESDVSMEKQITEIAKNQSQHNLAISLMSAQFRLLRAAVTERVA